MTRSFALLLAAALVAAAASAQQPNDSARGSLAVNATPGGPYPIAGVFVYGGTVATMDVRGGANVRFAVVNAPRLVTPGLPLLNGLVDLDLSDPARVVFYLDGFFAHPNVYRCTEQGTFTHFVPLPSSIEGGLTAAYQGIVEEPASPFGVVFTAATSIITSPGVQSQVIQNLGDDGCSFVNTQASFGFPIRYYSQSWNGCWICANGFISFGASNNDFTPTNPEMHTQAPKIAPFWSDLTLLPPNPGTVTATIDQTAPGNPIITVRYRDVLDWPVGVNGGLGTHDFGVVIEAATGDVTIQHFPSNQNSNYDIIVGMSAGNGLDPTGAGSMNLSAVLAQGPYVGLPNEGMYEGFRGVTSVTNIFPASQVYDLAGYAWKYTAVGAGQTGAFYVMELTSPPLGF